MVFIDFKKKLFSFFPRLYVKIIGILNLFGQKFFHFGFVSAKALFIVLIVLSFNVEKAKAEDSVSFLIDSSYDRNSRSGITAINITTGVNAYFYADNQYWKNLSLAEQNVVLQNIKSLSREFDDIIYPKMRDVYGVEWNPGIDNDSRIYILLTDIVKDAGGYYNPNDEYYKNQVKDNKSNEKEIIYLNTDFIGKSSMKSFLAHEFQHMINWHQKKKISDINEDVWLNESLSEYASTLLGYDDPFKGSLIELRMNNFLQNSSDSLTEWQNINQDYASVNLFMQFLVDQYGKSVIKAIVSSKKKGISAIDDALQKLNYNTNFNEVFGDWQIANYLNDNKINNGKYAYKNPKLTFEDFHIKPAETIVLKNDIPIENTEYTKDWSVKLFEFTSPLANDSQNRALKINFSAENEIADFKIPYLIKNIDGTIAIGAMRLDAAKKGTAVFDNFNTKIASVVFLPFSDTKTDRFTQSEPLYKFSYSVSLIKMNLTVINNIVPNNSSLEGGNIVTLFGENFPPNSIVKFGGMTAEVQFSNSKTIVVKAPPVLKSGNVDVEIIVSASSSIIAPQFFTYFSLPEDNSLIRAEGDYKVYVISGKYKRWIQSAEIFKFYPHFGWNSVVVVSPQVRDYYRNSFLVRAEGDYKVYEINADNSKHHLAINVAQFAASRRSWGMIYTINKQERDFYKTGSTITE